jgi:hypothetical protein
MENQKTEGYKNPAQFAFIHILIFLLSLSVRSLSLFSPSQTLIKEHRRFASVRRRELAGKQTRNPNSTTRTPLYFLS